MKKIILTFIATLLAGFSTAIAQNVAEVGGAEYPTLAEAVAQATDGQTITMIANSNEANEVVLESGASITLDLNGKTVTANDDIWVKTGSLTVVGSSGSAITSTGSAIYVSTQSIPNNVATLTINSSNVTVHGDGYGVVVMSGGVVNQLAGTITSTEHAAISTNGTNTGSTINITSGTVTSTGATAIYHPGPGTLTIGDSNCLGEDNSHSHPVITGKTGIEMRAGTLNVYCGEITGNGTFAESPNGSGSTIAGVAVAISQHSTNKAINVNIAGGTLNGTYGVYEKDLQDPTTGENVTIAVTGGDISGTTSAVVISDIESESVKASISGGTFTDEILPEYCAPGYAPIELSDGNYSVATAVAQIGTTPYATLDGAVAAVENGQTIEMLADITLTSNITCNLEDGQSFTLYFVDYDITKGDYSVSLPTGVSVTTDKQTDIFTTAAEGMVVKETDNGNNTYTYSVATIVAQIGTTPYATLKDAIDAAVDGDEIVIVADGPMGGRATIDGKAVTITGEGTINASGSTDGITVKNGGTLNLGKADDDSNDVTFDGGSTYHAPGVFQTEGNGTVNMYDGISVEKYNSNSEGCVQIQGNGDVFNMYGGSIRSTDDAATYGITVGTYGASTTGVFNLMGGTITGSDDQYWPMNVMSGTFNMTGGTVQGGHYAAAAASYDGKINISGGQVIGVVGDAGDDEDPFTGSIQISGGTYTVQPDADYIVEGYEAVALGTEPETWTVSEIPVAIIVETNTNYDSFAGAIAAVENGQTILLRKDVTLTEDVTCPLATGNSFTLNFDGKTITANGKKIILNPGVLVNTDATFNVGNNAALYGVSAEGYNVIAVKVADKQGFYAATLVDAAYVDAAGEDATAEGAVLLDAVIATFQQLPGGWYYAEPESELSFENQTRMNASGSNFIIGDGATVNFTNSLVSEGTITIFGQTEQTGTIVPTGNNNIKTFVQNGAKVVSTNAKIVGTKMTVNTGLLDIKSNTQVSAVVADIEEVNINGGEVTVEALGSYGVGVESKDITITGGKVTISGDVAGLRETSGSTIELSLDDINDFILVSSYDGTVKIKEGVTLYDKDDTETPYRPYSGTLNDEDKARIAGHRLVLASILRLDTDDETVLELYDTLDEAIAEVENGQFIHLTADVTLEDDIEVPLTTADQEFSLKFGTADIDGNGHHILLAEKVSVNTDKQTKIFAVLPELAETHAIKETQNEDGTYTYKYTTVEAVAYNKETGVRYATLQGAIDEATAGNTIVLMPAIEYPENVLDETVTINKNLTIEGEGYKVTSEAKEAFKVTGRGSVTINKIDLNATYEQTGSGIYADYTDGSIGIIVDEQFSDSLVINYSTITTAGQGIDIYKVGGGFVLDVKHTTIQSNVDDPTTEYINSFTGDPFSRGRGISFDHDATTIVANIQFSKIQGFAYPINVTANSGKVELNMTDCTTWGRDVINNWGDHSTFNLTNVTANGYNNETSADNESFAAIVDYKGADYNFYNIEDLRVVANVEAADANPTSATENFIDLRGTNATVKIVGNSGYEIADDIRDRVGFVNNRLSDDDVEIGETDAFKRMIDTTVNNRIYFDDQAKAYFNYWFEILTPFDYDYDGDDEDEYIRIAIDDEKDHTNLYPVVPLEVNVMLTIKPETEDDEDEAEPKVFYYEKLQDAFNSEMFASGAEITILKNITMDEDITPDLKRGEEFTLTSLKREDGETSPYTINPAGFHIYLDPLVIANYDYDENPGDIFAASNEEITTILMRKTTDLVGIYQPTYDTEGHINGYEKVDDENVDRYVYTAANVYWAMDIDDVADYGQYWLFDELFTNDPEAPCAIWPNTYNRLEMDLKLERNLKFPTGDIFDGGFEEYDPNDPGTDEPIDEPDDEVTPQQFWIDFNGFTLDKNEEFSIILKVGQEVYTTATTDIFSSGDPEYTVVYDAVEEEKTIEDGETKVKFLYKYYLMKDGLAVIVDPSTYCGDRLTPNFIVKKKVTTEEADPNDDTQTITKETWVELQGISQEEYDAAVEGDEDVSGYDFVWHLVPPATDDADDKTYIDAKTYVQAIVIEGITFQGTRKADFTILPRDIKDVTASGNEQPWTEEGYAPMSDEGEGIVGIEDLIKLQYFCKNHGDAANPILQKYVEEIDEITGELLKSGDYIISVEDGPETDPAGYYKEIDTYSKVITITAVEGGNYTGTLKLDFTILPEDMIDISKCMVISDATYTSAPLPPTENRISVIYKQTAVVADVPTEVEFVLPAEAYTIEVHGALDSYVDAKTYSNAITIVANPDYNVGTDDDPLRFYGTLDADYVIKQRDLADDSADPSENDNEGIVTLNAYAGADKPATTPKTIYLKWTGEALVPVINADDPEDAEDDEITNNINLILDAKADPVDDTTEPAAVQWKLIPADYSYTIEPSPMKDPGEYKIIFTGRGNFTGMREVNVMVLKDINEIAADINVDLQIIPDNYRLYVKDLKGIEVKDGNQTLVEGVHYTLEVKGARSNTAPYTYGENFSNPNAVSPETYYEYIQYKGLLYAFFKGKEPFYTDTVLKELPVVYEYYAYDDEKECYNKLPNGNYQSSGWVLNNANNPNRFSFRVKSGKLTPDGNTWKCEGEATVSAIDGIKNGTYSKTSLDPNEEIRTIDDQVYVAVGNQSAGTYKEIKFNIVGIEDNAFRDLPRIHCLDATKLVGYTPTTLSRTSDGPFNHYPLQSLVYLDGCSDVTGTNYIYKKGENDFRCEELKIYDDIKGDQQGFETDADYIGGGHAWEFRNIYQFVADKVTNTRVFTAGQHYTTCLPYKLQMNSALKAYTLDAASDNIFGFKQYTAKELDQFTPYVLIPSKGGNLLNNDESTVCYVTPTSNRGFLPLDERGNRRYDFATPTGHIMYGSNIYMGSSSTYPTVEGLYIMQSKNQWKRIPAGKTYNNACVLPMRGYIMLPNHPQISGANPSRESSDGPEYISAKYMDVDGVAEISIDANDDWTNAEVYDLQGRKVDTTVRLPKGVYIVNGQKRIRK